MPPTARRATRESRSGRGLRKRENTRARLREAAAEVIMAKGMEGARIDDVVRRAGFTRGAFYSNYSSLDEVLNEAIVERLAAMVERIEAAADAIEGEPTIDSLMEMLDSLRSEARVMYIICTEHMLHRMRHPDSPQVPAAGRRVLDTAIAGCVESLLARMGRRPVVAAQGIGDAVCLFFLDSLAEEATGMTIAGHDADDPRAYLRHIIGSIIMALSAPVTEGGAEAS